MPHAYSKFKKVVAETRAGRGDTYTLPRYCSILHLPAKRRAARIRLVYNSIMQSARTDSSVQGVGDSSQDDDCMSCRTRTANPNHYTSCYCEENVYLLAQRMTQVLSGHSPEDRPELFVVFISSLLQRTPIWCQASNASSPEDPVLWDYHVVLLQRDLEEEDAAALPL